MDDLRASAPLARGASAAARADRVRRGRRVGPRSLLRVTPPSLSTAVRAGAQPVQCRALAGALGLGMSTGPTRIGERREADLPPVRAARSRERGPGNDAHS